jgi:hypothetical protein
MTIQNFGAAGLNIEIPKKGNYFPTAAGLNIEISKKGNNLPTAAGLNIEIPKKGHYFHTCQPNVHSLVGERGEGI